MKKVICGVLLACILFFACDGPKFLRNTFMGVRGLGFQENTTWVSEDGTVTLQIHGRNDIHTGTIAVNGKQIEFKLLLNMGGMHLYPREEGKNFLDDSFEKWNMVKRNDDSFTIKTEETTYFEKRQKITFYRVT